jgi:hypothetical protein
MNNQYYNNCFNGDSTSAKSYLFNTQQPPNHFVLPHSYSPPVYCQNYSRGLIPSDNRICDEMNDCHLTESWAGYMNHNTTLTQISNQIPILNSFVPIRMPSDIRTNSWNTPRGTFSPHQNVHLKNLYYFEELNRIQENNGPVHPQQQLMGKGFSRLAELNYEPSTSHDEFNSAMMAPYSNAIQMSASMDQEGRVKTSIKFQDRNKKLDFKKNFRDENLKVNGCFHREGSKSPNVRPYDSTSTSVASPPKKKWIRHYLTGNESLVLMCDSNRKGFFL